MPLLLFCTTIPNTSFSYLSLSLHRGLSEQHLWGFDFRICIATESGSAVIRLEEARTVTIIATMEDMGKSRMSRRGSNG